MEKYPENNAACWTTKLRRPVQLKGRWEVCLSELHYMQSMFTIPTEQKMGVHYPISKGLGRNFIHVPAGIYKSAQELVDCISKQIQDLPPYPDAECIKQFKIEIQADRRVCISMGTSRVTVYFDRDSIILQTMLGFDQEQGILSPTDLDSKTYGDKDYPDFPIKHIGKRLVNLRVGNQTLYVYCDVADYGAVGDSLSQILRTVPIKGGPMDVVTERFDIGHYVPVILTTFENIRVELSNELGELVKFHAGKSMVKLHFRRYKAIP